MTVRRGLLAAVVVACAVPLLALPPALAAASKLKAARAELARGAELVRAMQLDRAGHAFARAGTLAAQAEARLDSPLAAPARALPLAGHNLRAARSLASGARLLAAAAREATAATAAFPQGPSGPSVGMVRGRIDPAPWPQAEEGLARAAALLRQAVGAVRSSGGPLLPPVAAARGEFLARGEEALRATERAAAGAGLVPELFGAHGPRTWFLALQNPVELRATGGLLGAFGILEAEAGELRLTRFESNLGLPHLADPPEAPEEFLARYGRFAPRRIWQNSNMTPDFPTAAALMAAMWEQGTGQHVDGVLAVDAVGLAALLRLTGPVTFPDVGEVTADNFLALALNEAYVRFPEKADRVDFLLEVGREVWRRLLAAEVTDARALAAALGDAVAGRHVQAWIPTEEERLRRLGIAGELEVPQAADHLLVVGQNAAGNKVDYYARREVSYAVGIGPGGETRGHVRVRLQNSSPASGLPRYLLGPHVAGDPPGLNRSYISVYLQPGSGVAGAWVDGQPVGVESHTERGLAVASRFLEVPAGASSTLDLDVRGRLARPGEYRLVVRRQPSLHEDSLRLEVEVPPGMVPAEVTPGMRTEGRRVTWEGPLASDREFAVRFRPSGVERLERLTRDLVAALPGWRW